MTPEYKALLEVYTNQEKVLEEAKKETFLKLMTQDFGVPEHKAKEFYDMFGKFSKIMIHKIMKAMSSTVSKTKLYMILDDPKYMEKLKTISDWLKAGKGLNGNLGEYRRKEYSLEDLYNEAEKWHQSLYSEEDIKDEITFDKAYQEQNRVVRDYRDENGLGYYWVDLETSRCSKEAERMGNCGIAGKNNTMLILRKNEIVESMSSRKHTAYRNLSRVVITVSEEERIVRELKGRFNKVPDKKYIPYIVDLLANTKEVLGFKEKAAYSNDDLTIDDFSNDDMEKILTNNPDFQIEFSDAWEKLGQESDYIRTIKEAMFNAIERGYSSIEDLYYIFKFEIFKENETVNRFINEKFPIITPYEYIPSVFQGQSLTLNLFFRDYNFRKIIAQEFEKFSVKQLKSFMDNDMSFAAYDLLSDYIISDMAEFSLDILFDYSNLINKEAIITKAEAIRNREEVEEIRSIVDNDLDSLLKYYLRDGITSIKEKQDNDFIDAIVHAYLTVRLEEMKNDLLEMTLEVLEKYFVAGPKVIEGKKQIGGTTNFKKLFENMDFDDISKKSILVFPKELIYISLNDLKKDFQIGNEILKLFVSLDWYENNEKIQFDRGYDKYALDNPNAFNQVLADNLNKF